MKKYLCAALFALALSGCGVKSPPLPPAEAETPAPEGLRVRAREGCVELAWKNPPAGDAANTAAGAVAASGSTVQQSAQSAARTAGAAGIALPLPVAGYEVLRASEPAPGEEPVFKTLGETEATAFRDCPGAEGRYLYRVRAVSPDGKRSELSRPSAATFGPVPAAPERLAATGGDRFVELTWRRPSGLVPEARFNVYRSTAAGKFSWRPVNAEPLADARFSDGPLENGFRYYYEVRVVLPQARGAWSEGPAAGAEATPVDRVAPGAPQGLIAGWDGKAVELRWFKNPEDDLAGYYVYRRTAGGRFARLTEKPLTDNTYTDRSARPGRNYEYAVTAVDNAPEPNESPASAVQSIYTSP